MSRLKLVQGDTRPAVVVQLTDPLGPIDVSTATVRMRFRRAGQDTVLQTLTGTLLPGTVEVNGYTPDLSQYPTAGSGGRVQFEFPTGALDIDPGYYEGEVEITYADDDVQTGYYKLKFTLREQF